MLIQQGSTYILSKYAKIEGALPIGSILTLPATGSEMNDNSVFPFPKSERNCKETFWKSEAFKVGWPATVIWVTIPASFKLTAGLIL